MPGFERWLLTYSADRPDAIGYRDFALGAFGAEQDWREAVREILASDWRFQFEEWNQPPWAYVWRSGLVSDAEAREWRAAAGDRCGGERDRATGQRGGVGGAGSQVIAKSRPHYQPLALALE